MKRSISYPIIIVLLLLLCGVFFLGRRFHEQRRRGAIAKADADIMQLSSVLKTYYVEYGTFLQGDNAALTRSLRGDNPRKIVFIDLPASSINDHGEFIDPWGHPYRFDLRNPKGARIWSIGPKGKDAPDDPSSGDICSWR